MPRDALGVDLGGTKTALGLCSPSGEVRVRRVYPTSGPQEFPKQVRAFLRAADVAVEHLEGIGVGAPGPLDLPTGRILHTPNLPSWRGVSVVDLLVEAFGVPVYLDNDATAAALGEARFGTQAEDLVYVTLSTGIGGGIVLGGRVQRGASGNAGEFGHMVLEWQGPPCECGKRGCWEALASGSAIARRARELGLELEPGQELREEGAEAVFERARRGDPRARQIVREAARVHGWGLANLAEVFDPQVIVLGGGLVRSWDQLKDELLTAFRVHARREIPLSLSPLGEALGVVGAAALVFEGRRDVK